MNNFENNYEYNSEQVQEKKPLSHYIKKFLLAFLFVVILLFLLLWLFPTRSGLRPLYDRIFQDNLTTMKDVATSYFTTERLPKNVGETKILTLRDMLEMKLLLPVKDRKGNMCDIDSSYVELTKLDNEYKMKVNLKCGNEEDYIFVYLGCYNYCETDICEKQEEVVKEKPKYYCVQVNGKYYDKNGKVTTKAGYQKSCIATKYTCAVVNGKYYDNKGKVVSKSAYQKACKKQTPKYYCAIVNGKYYDKNGKVTTKAGYEKSCITKKYYCAVVNGKYYDKNGKVTTKAGYEDSCITKKYYCALVNGKYYDKNGNVVSKSAYEKSCFPESKYYCAVVNGKYYDKNGNVVSKSAYEKSCFPEDEPIYRYLYEKTVTTGKEYSNWSNWSSDIEYNPNTTSIDWGQHEYVWYEKNGSKTSSKSYYVYTEDRTKPVYNTTYDRLIGYKTQYACKGYNYYISNTTSYTYKVTDWVKTGRTTLTYLPTQTESKRYVYVGMDYDKCNDTCTLKPYYIFDIYTRTITKVPTTKKEVSATCSNVVEKQIPIYGKKTTFAGYVTNRTTQTEKTTKYYYHKKTRTLIKDKETKVYKAWSDSKNDKSLINEGYKYTGVSERIN